MSKVVKSVTRTVSKVVKSAVSVIKKVASSKLGKILVTAAAVYFGGAALAGGFGSSAAGGSFLSGIGTGVANAASSFSTAWDSALSGNFSGAGSALASGFQGQAAGGMTTSMAGAGGAAGAGTSGVTQANIGASMGGAQGISAPASSLGTVGGSIGGGVGAGVGTGVGAGAGAGGMSVGEGLMGAAKIQAGTALIGGVMQGKGQADAVADQRAYEESMAQQARGRADQNIGAQLWKTSSTPDTAATGGAFAYDPYAELQRLRAAREAAAAQPAAGIIARNTTGYSPYRT